MSLQLIARLRKKEKFGAKLLFYKKFDLKGLSHEID
jgi:hypothetical protein